MNTLLVLVDSDEDSLLRFSSADMELLNRGEVLVYTDVSTNKTILQVKPSAVADTFHRQANELIECISKGSLKKNYFIYKTIRFDESQ